MPEPDLQADDEIWEAGFEGGRSVVVSRLGPWLRVSPRPQRHSRRFWQQIHELPIRDWRIVLEPLRLGSFCQIAASLNIRFQPTLRYARAHPEHLPELDQHIRASHEALLKDVAEQHLRILESDTRWLEHGYTDVERAIARDVNESLAVRDIQCRSRCHVEARFDLPAEPDPRSTAPWSRHRAIYLELLRRQHESEAAFDHAQAERSLAEQRRKLQRERELLELAQQREELRKRQLEREIERLRAELAAEETRLADQRASEARLSEEQIRHTARLRELERESDLQENTRRAAGMDDMESHLKREIELLALERQRLLLEDEVRETRLAKARGWVINAKKRFPLGEGANPPPLHIPPAETDDGDGES
jgi:hypothetical protein